MRWIVHEGRVVIEPATVTAGVLAELFGITERRVQKLAADGFFPRDAPGQYRFAECVTAYVSFWRERAEGRVATGIDAHRAAKESARARMAELDLQEREGSLVAVEAHRAALVDAFAEVRSNVLNLPVVTAPELVGIESERAVAEILIAAVDRCLAGMVAAAAVVEAKGGGPRKAPARKRSR